MTALLKSLPLETTPPPASRKDVLGLHGNHSKWVETPSPRTIWNWLENLGFVIRQPMSGHWIVTHSRTKYPELHFYSIAELGQFAAHRAHRYARPLSREER